MKVKSIYIIGLLLLLVSCSNSKKEALSDMDVAREFIKDCNENNFAAAKQFLLPDAANQDFLQVAEKSFSSKNEQDLAAYKNADLIIHEFQQLGDTVSILTYSNSHKKDIRQKLKLVKVNEQWLVDLKYTF
ncbi:MAG: hypothetical protein RLY16_1739 [Bacteroidota bacterium]|jgi:hypothetical protein